LLEGAPLTCTLTSNSRATVIYTQTCTQTQFVPHTALHFVFGVRDEYRSICQMFAGFIVPVLRLPICVRDTKRKRDKDRRELTECDKG